MVDYGFYMNSYRGSSIPAESWTEYENYKFNIIEC